MDSETAILLRKAIEVDQDPKTLHAEAIVRADWFFRETMESVRSPSYYDLLFANQRLVTQIRREKAHLSGYRWRSVLRNGGLTRRKRPSKFVDFPKNMRPILRKSSPWTSSAST